MIFCKVTQTYTIQEPAAFLHEHGFWILLVVESNILRYQRAEMGDFASLQDGAEVRSTPALPFLDVSSGFQLLRCRQQLLPCTTEA